MPIQRYSINQHPIEALLTWIKSDEIAIPAVFFSHRPKVYFRGHLVGYGERWGAASYTNRG